MRSKDPDLHYSEKLIRIRIRVMQIRNLQAAFVDRELSVHLDVHEKLAKFER
jgi:hypothetical protein